MTTTPEIEETLNALQTARMNSKRFERAEKHIIELAEKADEKNRPGRERRKAADELARKNRKPGESIPMDLTPEWRGVLPYYVRGIRNKNNPPGVTDGLMNGLRGMAIYATTENDSSPEVCGNTQQGSESKV